jgi:hypothetical protein
VIAKAVSLASLLLVLGAACASARSVQQPLPFSFRLEQLLPRPPIAALPVPAPLPPPINPGAPAAPPQGISPLLLQPGPVFTLPQRASPSSPPPTFPAPIDQQKIGSYEIWLSGQLRLLERRGVSPDDLLFREIQQQLLQLDQSGGSP